MNDNKIEQEQPEKKQLNRPKWVGPIIIVLASIVIFLLVMTNNGPNKSQVDGISDEVYKELVQWYFYTVTFMELYVNKERDGAMDLMWFEDHELYKDAEQYVADHDDAVRPTDVFPNPLILNHHKKPDQYTDNEQKYINKMEEFIHTFQRVDFKEYEILKEEIKEGLRIKDSYNPFD